MKEKQLSSLNDVDKSGSNHLTGYIIAVVLVHIFLIFSLIVALYFCFFGNPFATWWENWLSSFIFVVPALATIAAAEIIMWSGEDLKIISKQILVLSVVMMTPVIALGEIIFFYAFIFTLLVLPIFVIKNSESRVNAGKLILFILFVEGCLLCLIARMMMF